MYSYEDRMRAVQLYIQYGCRAAPVIRELGYPNRHMIVRWHKEYLMTGGLHVNRDRPEKYSEQQKQHAIQHYLNHGKSISFTTRELGYPSRTLLIRWLNDAIPDRRKRCVSGGAVVECPQEKKEQAVIDLCARRGSAREVAAAHGVSCVSLYAWKKQLLSEERTTAMI